MYNHYTFKQKNICTRLTCKLFVDLANYSKILDQYLYLDLIENIMLCCRRQIKFGKNMRFDSGMAENIAGKG